ncbi:DUF551 domain-containing protein [Paenibacillus chitinolyticus]|uniref:DUF551 domain-containing protein n=1 Tax=Paenibacillus chitinolyticus TaxID=79263 RepID=UPI00366CFBF0
MEWIDVNDRLPGTRERVLAFFVNSYGYPWVTCAEYIAPKTILESEYMDEQYTDGGDYDKEKDCYWTTSGWYEHNYEPETNWMLTDRVTHWMPMPQVPV